jgi:metallo-beta-lactamase class B
MTAFRTFRAAILITGILAISSLVHAQLVEDRTQDKVAFPAHKIMGNLYYVGTGTLNSYLITTPAGHILLNTNFEDTIPLLRASVEKLGFKMTDIKIILGSHAHGDHQQADGTVKDMTGGAMVIAMEQDVPALKNMMVDKKPHPIDRVIKDGEQVTLGGTSLTAHLTPGHTRGCTTWAMKLTDGGRTYDVLIACGGLQEDARLVNNKNYPDIADAWAQSITKYKTLPADLFLASHSWFFDLAGKHARLASATNPYIDPQGFKNWVANMEKNYNSLLAEQRKNPPAN